ncbi:MAG: hypothetical protein IKY59_01030 [Oscillospiraceae bacterium]|nr:hypothetical protein [Oscillospiraceae bacterium]
MKTVKRIKALSLAVLMLLTVMMLCACQNNDDTQATTAPMGKTAVYKVTVLGVDGQPATDGVIVRFLKNGQEVAMQKTNANGVAAKELDRDDYTVEIMFINANASYYYDPANMTLSAEKTELTVELANQAVKAESTLFAGGQDHDAYRVDAGLTHVTLAANGRTYFLFTPSESGVYRLSTVGDTYVVGYFGGPHFVQEMNAGEADGNATLVNVTPDNIGTNGTGTTVLVIGVDNPGTAVETMLKVERVGAYVDHSIPVVTYKTTGKLTPWTMPAGATTSSFDLTKPTGTYNLVLDEATGFYHLDSVDGPLVLVCLGTASNKLLKYAASYDTILQTVGVNKYFTDADGNYTHREDYGQCLIDYIGLCDAVTGQYTGGCVDRATGLYPLTDDLMYIIQQNGDHQGWWNLNGPNYLFKDPNGNNDVTINNEIAWLFMCVYMN